MRLVKHSVDLAECNLLFYKGFLDRGEPLFQDILFVFIILGGQRDIGEGVVQVGYLLTQCRTDEEGILEHRLRSGTFPVAIKELGHGLVEVSDNL